MTLIKGHSGDAVAAAASEKAPQAVVGKDVESPQALRTKRSCLTVAEMNLPDQNLVVPALGRPRPEHSAGFR